VVDDDDDGAVRPWRIFCISVGPAGAPAFALGGGVFLAEAVPDDPVALCSTLRFAREISGIELQRELNCPWREHSQSSSSPEHGDIPMSVEAMKGPAPWNFPHQTPFRGQVLLDAIHKAHRAANRGSSGKKTRVLGNNCAGRASNP